MVAAPRSGGTEKVQVRLPEYLITQMDHTVTSGKFSSRSEFLRHVIERFFTMDDETLDEVVYKRINEGRYDDVLKKRITEIISEIIIK